MKRLHNTATPFVAAALVMLMGLSGVSSTALAVAPSGSPLSIDVTVTHSDDTVGTEADRVYFEVNLSPSPLQLTSPPDQARLQGEDIVYPYTAVSTANGPDNYFLFLTSVFPENTDGAPTAILRNLDGAVISSLTLGATAASGSMAVSQLGTWIPVPSDGVADNSINGIEAGDTVYVHGQVHSVASVEDDGTSASIVLAEEHGSTINVGDMISEGASFELVVSGVTIADLENDATVGVLITATSEADNDQSTQDETLTTVYAPIPASTEYWVRNVTNPNGEGDAGYATADESYYGTGGQVKASAGDELEYIIVQSAGNTGDLNDVVITATMPMFTTYVGNSTHLNGELQADASDNPAQSALSGRWEARLNVGTIAKNGQANMTFRVIVDDMPESGQGGRDQGQQGKPQGEKVAWTSGNDACWDERGLVDGASDYPNKVIGSWVAGACAGAQNEDWCYCPGSYDGETCEAPNREYCGQDLCNRFAESFKPQSWEDGLEEAMYSFYTGQPSDYRLLKCM